MKLGKLGKSAAQNENKLGDNSVPWANQVPSWASKKVEMFRSYCSFFFSPGSASFLAERAQSSEIVALNLFRINCNSLLIFKEDY